MAKYKYDRYSVGSSTYTYYEWSRYTTKEVLEYVADTSWQVGSGAVAGPVDSYSGAYRYTFDSSTGHFKLWGSGTIYPGSGGFVYSGGGSSVTRYAFGSGSSRYVYYATLGVREAYTKIVPDQLAGTTYAGYSAYTSGAVNSDGYYYVRGSSYTSTRYYRGSYIDTIVAEDGTYPADGRSGSYWYVRRDRAFPDLAVKVNSQLGTSIDGWVKVSGQLGQIVSITVKEGGQLREV